MKNPHTLDLGMKSELYKKIIHYSEVKSTNDIAMDLAEQGVEEGTVVVADTQTEGRGRAGRTWSSPVGGLWFTIILRPDIEPVYAHQITFAASIAVTTAIGNLRGLQAQIKWPNDILIKEKKVGGILLEIATSGSTVEYLVVGIGLNLTVDPHHFPPEVSNIATSIASNLRPGTKISRDEILRSILREFEVYYQLLKQKGFRHIIQKWKGMSNIVGREIRVDDPPNEPMEGKVVDIDTTGALLIRTSKNAVLRVVSGTVTIVERSDWPWPIRVPSVPFPFPKGKD
ncbi:MAG: biotin--[acetyl-CoA-carboxylase] ligase [Candidatus Hodarchaeota archaeon]